MGGMPGHSGRFSRDSGTFRDVRSFMDSGTFGNFVVFAHLAYLLGFWTPSSNWNLGMVSRASRGGPQVSGNTLGQIDFGIGMPINTPKWG